MRARTPFIAVDWGTTHMRAWLCDRSDATPETTACIHGAGIARLSRAPASALLDSIQPWVETHGSVDLLLGGMVGSDIGWRTAPYLPCPVRLVDLRESLLFFEDRGHNISIVPGVMCTNSLGQPDVMRGEETQVFGWMASNPLIASDESWLCLPGTHTKWVRIKDGAITAFTTAVTGELYATLCNHSVLVPDTEKRGAAFDRDAFLLGVDNSQVGGDRLTHLLFSTRARSLGDAAFGESSPSYLSGLLIGADVAAWAKDREADGETIGLIGDLGLCEKYAMAISRIGLESRTWSGDAMALTGFLAIAGAAK